MLTFVPKTHDRHCENAPIVGDVSCSVLTRTNFGQPFSGKGHKTGVSAMRLYLVLTRNGKLNTLKGAICSGLRCESRLRTSLNRTAACLPVPTRPLRYILDQVGSR